MRRAGNFLQFFAKNGQFYPKIIRLAHFGSRKIGKKPDIQNWLPFIVASTLGYTSTNYLPNWTISLKLVQFSAEIFFFKFFFFENRQKLCFWPKNGHFLVDFAEILGINKNHLNTSYVKILGHLGHFWQNMAIFFNFWPILAYNLYVEKCSFVETTYFRKLPVVSCRCHTGILYGPFFMYFLLNITNIHLFFSTDKRKYELGGVLESILHTVYIKLLYITFYLHPEKKS